MEAALFFEGLDGTARRLIHRILFCASAGLEKMAVIGLHR